MTLVNSSFFDRSYLYYFFAALAKDNWIRYRIFSKLLFLDINDEISLSDNYDLVFLSSFEERYVLYF